MKKFMYNLFVGIVLGICSGITFAEAFGYIANAIEYITKNIGKYISRKK